MISVTGKKWLQQRINKNLVEKVKQDYNLNYDLSQFIVSRNYDTSEIHSINNTQKINNIFIKDYDFQKASSIVSDAIKKNENICILGDYDVDGSCATSLLVRFFNHINQPHFFYIPDRVIDGYGASKKLFQKLILKVVAAVQAKIATTPISCAPSKEPPPPWKSPAFAPKPP